MRVTLLFVAVAWLPACYRSAHGDRSSVAAITFVVDTSSELTPAGPGPVKPLGLQVTFGAHRGRVDVRARPARPPLKIGDVIAGPSLANPGDYYLFDSTGFVLVRPSAKQFATFEISDAAFNYEGRRDGWPEFFRFAPTRIDTIAGDSVMTVHGEQRLYWHLDVVKDTVCGLGGCSVEELARGRTTLADAPVAEVIVARWFGPAQALAQIAGGVDRLVGKPIRVTTVSPMTGVKRLRDLRATRVTPAFLTLPPDYSQVPWRGFSEMRGAQPSNRSAKWRALPGRQLTPSSDALVSVP